MESVLSHFLLYGSDPHKIFGVGGYITLSLRPRWDGRWFGCSGQLRAMEIARFWASWVREGCKEIESQDQIERPSAPELRANYEEEEIQRIPRLASWSSDGTVFYTRPPAYPINRSVDPPRPLPPLLKKTRDAFQRTSLFYEMIATPEGRSHLSRFPHVCLLVNALQLAGYRAEMDDGGDIWWDVEDGDRYFDARESQPCQYPEDDDDDADIANCPMCRDPEKYGLGHIVEEEERAKRTVREYKEAIKKRGKWDTWCE
ncbi:hypothetical protein MGN70_010621 [Eutypa lata]|nr:hypothetical protein MGN70_010621 [Eutypa lata]